MSQFCWDWIDFAVFTWSNIEGCELLIHYVAIGFDVWVLLLRGLSVIRVYLVVMGARYLYCIEVMMLMVDA